MNAVVRQLHQERVDRAQRILSHSEAVNLTLSKNAATMLSTKQSKSAEYFNISNASHA
jgi:hypothetical protein